jgi:hypothetical protein
MVTRIPDGIESEAKAARRVVVVYENNATREQALRFCNQLAENLCSPAELDVHWCSFSFLLDPASAGNAAEKAIDAEFIVFAVSVREDLPDEIKFWIENWLGKRNEREGAVVGLVDCPCGPGELPCLKEIYLRQVAHRAGLDYLSRAPSAGSTAIPDSLESYGQRAGQVTSLLDEILHCQPPPPPP